MEKQHVSAPVEKEDDPANIIFQEDNIPLDLQALDKTFRCSICGSLFDKAVTIKNCGHTYCSICIRNHWVASRNGVHRKEKSCPMCRNAVDQDVDKALVMNRNIQEGVEVFKLMLLKTRKSSNQIKDSSSSSRKKRRRAVREVSDNIDYDEGSNEDHKKDCDSDNEEEEDEDEDQELTIQKTMQSRNYGRMGKKDLQKICREYTLPTSGNDEDLKKRLRSFQSMWNAEIDSINPLKPSDLAKKLKKTEQAQRDEKNRALMSGAANDSEHLKKLNASLKNENEVFTSGNIKFDKMISGNFKKLEAELRERKSGSASTKSSTEAIEIIDIDSSFDIPDGDQLAISSSETDQKVSTAMNEENNYVPYPARSILAPNKNTVSSSTNSLSSSSECGLPILPKSKLSIKNQYPANLKKKRPSPSSKSSSSAANSSTWACTHCTYENMSQHYLCRMCSKRKIEN